jgi:hypothetical protein
MRKEDGTFGAADIRRALRSRLLVKHANEPDTVFIEELGVCRGQVRIDLAVVNGLFHGYEIKSDRDSLRRFDGQVELYSKVLDRATIVVGNSHLTETLNIVPRWWGVLLIDSGRKGPRFRTVRRGQNNPRKDPRALVELLWLDDAIALLALRDAARGVRGKPRRVVWDRVCEHFKVQEIAATVRARLKAKAAQ